MKHLSVRPGFGVVQIGRERDMRGVLATHRRPRHRHGDFESFPENSNQTGSEIPFGDESDGRGEVGRSCAREHRVGEIARTKRSRKYRKIDMQNVYP